MSHKLDNDKKNEMLTLIKEFEYKPNPKNHFGTSYTSINACKISSLYGLEEGDYVSTLVDESGSPICLYLKGTIGIQYKDEFVDKEGVSVNHK